MNPLFSVIINNYNYGKYLSECIQSVLDQTYANIELIIVDDGSDDISRKIIKDFQNKKTNIKVHLKKNGGQASAFNAGYNLATGDYISFLDSDDFWFTRRVEKIIQHFGEDNSFQIIQHNSIVVDENSNCLNKIHQNIKFTGYTKNHFLKNCNIWIFAVTSGLAFKRKILSDVFPIDEKWKIAADVPLRYGAGLNVKLKTSQYILGAYRIHDCNNWMNNPREKLKSEVIPYLNSSFKKKYGKSIKGISHKCKIKRKVNKLFHNFYSLINKIAPE